MDTENINWMKAALWVLIIVSLAGCAALKQNVADYDACAADPVCAAKMETAASSANSVAGIIGAGLGSPISIPIAVGAGLISSLIAGFYFGKKKRSP